MLKTKKTRITMKPPTQSPSAHVSNLMFEGVYNNARMLHFLTAVVGSTCDVRVKNGSVYEGVFKTLSSECELAVDAVHKLRDGGGDEGGGGPWRPKVEDITDTMVFRPSDLVTMTCRDVDLNFAIRDSFTDPSIGSSHLNGDHRDKVLQRWDGDGNGENYELESESNGWDANDMFKFNEDTYGVKSTYDSSLSTYTMPLERGNSEVFRQREARATRLANEIESSAQYRRRVSLENEEGRSDEDKYSAVVRERDDRGGAGAREGKYVPLPQRTREIMRGGASSRPSAPPTSSPKPACDRSSPLSVRPASSSPPCTNHVLPHSLSHPQTLSAASRPHVNGVSSRTSLQSHRPQVNRTQNHRTLLCQSSSAGKDSPDRTCGPVPVGLPCLVIPSASHAPKPDVPLHLDSSPSVTTVTTPSSLSAPLFSVDVNEILNSSSKDRMDSGPGSGSGPQDEKSSRAPSVQQRSQLEELRKFGKEFRLQSTLSSVDPPPPPPDSTSPPKPFDLQTSAEMSPPTSTPAAAVTPPSSGSEVSQSRTSRSTPFSSDESSSEINEQTEAAATQVKNSTLNPNAKEFQPVKGHSAAKSASAPPPPRLTPPSPSVVLNPSPPAGQPGAGAIYSSPPGPYLSYVSPLPLQGHSIQGQMYQYAMSAVTQGKYPRPKGAVVSSRPDHSSSSSSSSIISAPPAGPPLVSPYAQSYLQYGQVIQTVAPPYHGQTVYSMLHGGARLLTSGAPPPQPMGPPGQQYPGPTEGPGGPQQGLYAAQSFSHHSGAIHPPQPSTTPTGTQAPPQHPAPSPGHSQVCVDHQTGPAPPPSMFHSGPLSTPTPPGHASAQTPYPVQGYSLNPHQTLAHGFTSISQLTQAHISAGLSGPHHSAGHGHPPVMLHYAPHQQAGGSGPQQGAPQHFYIGPHQAVQVQTHSSQTLTFHPSAN